jgi:hypothetical protein
VLFGTHLVAALLIGRVTTLAPLWLVVGAVTPDVIDKPVAMAGVTDLFHSLGHSTALLILVVPIALYSRAGLAAAIGWASHLLLDGVHVVINGRPGDVLFLFWPVVRPADPLKLPPGEFLLYYLWTPSFFLELCLWIALAGLLLRSWIRDDPEPSATGTDTR